MANGEYRVTEEEWKIMTPETRSWMIFNTFNSYREKTDRRISNLEKRKKFDSVISAASGFIGGFIAIISSRALK